jgi:hypothetical protein
VFALTFSGAIISCVAMKPSAAGGHAWDVWVAWCGVALWSFAVAVPLFVLWLVMWSYTAKPGEKP